MFPTMPVDLDLLHRAIFAVRLDRDALATKLTASRRSITRWLAAEARPTTVQVATLARLVHEAGDASIAVELATAAGTTLVALGLARAPEVVPPPTSARPSPLVVDAVVCAAADAFGFTPSAVRDALFAAFERAAALGLTTEEVAAALRPKESAAPAKRTKKS